MKEKLQAISLIIVLIIIIAIMCHMNQHYENYANFKCYQNGYKLAFPEKINNSGILKKDLSNTWYGYSNIPDGRITPMTLDNDSRLYLNDILGKVLNNINKQTGAKYMLRKIDSINKESIKQGSVSGHQVEREIQTRLTIDFFAHELTKQETRRLIVILTIDNNRNVNVEHINLSNAFKYNFMDYKCIISGPNPDDLIHTDKAMGNNDEICGIDETKQDYSLLTNLEKITAKNYGYAKPNEMSQTIFLPNAVHDVGMLEDHGYYPNRKHTGWWDKNGVSLVELPDCDKPKTGLDHAIGKRSYQPYDNPTVARYEAEVYKNKHHSNFDLARGNFLGRNLSM
jgi:hypothetical protein